MRRRSIPDPAWKSGPTEPKPTSSSHAIAPEDFAHAPFDFDGFGRDEAEAVDGEPLIVIRERVECRREGCDAAHSRSMLFTTHTLGDDDETRLRRDSSLSADAALAEHVWEHAERVDVDTIDVNGVTITPERIIEDEASGPCYGRVEPEPDVHAHRYDL